MDSNHLRSARRLVLATTCLALIAISACTSKSESGTRPPATTSDDTGSRIDVMCIGERINNPSEPFHYSYRYSDASGSTTKEAEITPQAMEITISDQSGSHSYHGMRSDDVSWNKAVLDLSGLNLTAMSSRLDSLNDSTAVSRQAAEATNGYDATRYAIDTTKASGSDQQEFAALFGKGASEKGAVWMSADGCAVKLVLDERILRSDGTPKDDHYEVARIKK